MIKIAGRGRWLPRNWSGWFAMLIILCCVGLTTAASGLVVRGDLQAWTEIERAVNKLNALKTYRARFRMSQSAGRLEVVNPDRYRTVFETGGVVYEIIQVGPAVRSRLGGRKWECSGQKGTVPQINLKSQVGEVQVARTGTAILDGVKVHTYVYTRKRSGASLTSRLSVAAASGLPKRYQALDGRNRIIMQLDYYDYDVPFSIALPSCQ